MENQLCVLWRSSSTKPVKAHILASTSPREFAPEGPCVCTPQSHGPSGRSSYYFLSLRLSDLESQSARTRDRSSMSHAQLSCALGACAPLPTSFRAVLQTLVDAESKVGKPSLMLLEQPSTKNWGLQSPPISQACTQKPA